MTPQTLISFIGLLFGALTFTLTALGWWINRIHFFVNTNWYTSTNDTSLKLKVTINNLSASPVKIKELFLSNSEIKKISEIPYDYEKSQEAWRSREADRKLEEYIQEALHRNTPNTSESDEVPKEFKNLNVPLEKFKVPEAISELADTLKEQQTEWKKMKRSQFLMSLEISDRVKNSSLNIRTSASRPLVGPTIIGPSANQNFTYWLSNEKIPTRLTIVYFGKIIGFKHKKNFNVAISPKSELKEDNL